MTLPAQPAGKFRTFIDGEHAPAYHCLQIQIPSGGQRTHTATFEKLGTEYDDLNRPGRKLRTLVNSPEIFKDDDAVLDYIDNSECTVYFYPFDYNEITEPRRLVHFGRLSAAKPKLKGSQLLVSSRAEFHMFSTVSNGSAYYHYGNENEGEIALPPVFNPVVDGTVQGNHSQRPNNDAGTDKKEYFWHPDEDWLQFNWGPAYSGYNPSFLPIRWTLPAAVNYLIQAHAYSDILKMPTREEIDAMFDNPPEISDVKIPSGLYLHEMLNLLLSPMGYSFKFEPIDEGDEQNPDVKFQFIAWARDRGLEPHDGTAGNNVPLTLEKVATTDKIRSDIDDVVLNLDLSDQSANAILILGDPIIREGTFELGPGWEKDNENFDTNVYRLNNQNASMEVRRTYRDYVLNETGFYNRNRRGDLGENSDSFPQFDMNEFFGTTDKQLNRSRKFLPCISLDPLGNPRGENKGVRLQIWDGANWQPFNGPFDILQSECGIRLMTNTLDQQFLRVRRFRITAAIQSDERLSYFREIDKNKISTEVTRQLVIDTKDKFKRHERQSVGPNASIMVGSPTSPTDFNDEVDQEQEMIDLADRIAKAYQKTSFRGTVALTDQQWYGNDLVGRRVEKFNIRNIDLNNDTETGDSDKSYPVITGVTMDIQTQSSAIYLDAYAGNV